MRTIILVFSLWGCQGAPVDEHCSNGVDDDLDGLVDCEDGDCASQCLELRCEDGVDDDLDGLVDCEDDDCWGGTCPEARARVHGGEVDLAWHTRIARRSGESSGHYTSTTSSGTVVGTGLWGTVAWASTTCTWELDRVDLTAKYERDIAVSHELLRDGLHLDPTCARDDLMLPGSLRPGPLGVDLVPGLPWYAGQAVSSTASSTSVWNTTGAWMYSWHITDRVVERQLELFPAATWVVCDGVEPTPHWPDVDRDGAGDAASSPSLACGPGPGLVPNADDCDDTRPDVPGDEVCGNGIDDDCDGGHAPCAVRGHLDGRGATWLEGYSTRLVALDGPGGARIATAVPEGLVVLGLTGREPATLATATGLGDRVDVTGAGDVDADGWEDLVVGSRGWGGVTILPGVSTGALTLDDALVHLPGSVAYHTADTASHGDADGDGFADLALGASLLSGASLSQGLGEEAAMATFEATEFVWPTGRPLLVDRDGDGLDELVLAVLRYSEDQPRTYQELYDLGSGLSGTLAPTDGALLLSGPEHYGYTPMARFMEAADLDGDGRGEVVLSGERRELCVVAPDDANAQGYESLHTRLVAPESVYFLEYVGDLDGDGADELAVGGSTGLHVLSRPSGVVDVAAEAVAHVDTSAFGTEVGEEGQGAYAPAHGVGGDLDGDGYRDLAVGYWGDPSAIWLFFGGDGW